MQETRRHVVVVDGCIAGQLSTRKDAWDDRPMRTRCTCGAERPQAAVEQRRCDMAVDSRGQAWPAWLQAFAGVIAYDRGCGDATTTGKTMGVTEGHQ